VIDTAGQVIDEVSDGVWHAAGRAPGVYAVQVQWQSGQISFGRIVVADE
jgi:hypothetical protein